MESVIADAADPDCDAPLSDLIGVDLGHVVKVSLTQNRLPENGNRSYWRQIGRKVEYGAIFSFGGQSGDGISPKF